MPVIFTYPPNGSAPIAYSVSPRRTRKMVGGKNSEKRSTRIPTAFAAVKCPSSCSTISATMPSTVRTQLTALSVGRRRSTSAKRGDRLRSDGPCLAVGLIQRLERTHRLAWKLRQGLLDHPRDLHEPQTALEECVDGDLVGRVQHTRR